MSTQLSAPTQLSNEIIDNASQFAEFLSSETIAPIRKTITLIPNVIKDIFDVALQHKQLRIQDKNYRRKAELAKKCLELQDIQSQRQYRVELERIRTSSDTAITEIKSNCKSSIAKINAETATKLAQIESDERMKLTEIYSQHDLNLKKIDNERKMFSEALRESNRRYNIQIKNIEKVQFELSQIINAITKKIIAGTATTYEYSLIEFLSSAKIQALDKSFNLSDSFLNMFSGGI